MVYVVSYLAIVVFQFVLLLSFFNLLQKKIKLNIKHIIVIFIYSFVELFLSFFINLPINGIISVLYFILLVKWVSNLKFRDIYFYVLVIWILGIVVDITIMLILTNVFKDFVPQLYSNYVKPISTVWMAICLLLITRIKHIKYIVSNINNRIKKLNLKFFKLLLLLIIYLLIDAICIININNSYMIVILVVVTFLITYIFIYKYEVFNLKITNKLLIQNNEFYIKVINDYHILKHNLINQLLGIKSVSNKKTKLIIDDIIKEYNSSYKISQNINDIPSGLSGIVFEKLYNYSSEDINIVIDNKIGNNIFDYLMPRSYNLLCEAIGIILDNALEATINSNDKILYIKFNENNDCIIVTVINSFSGIIDLENLGNFQYSTKSSGNGYGLFTLFSKRKLNVKTSIKNNLFTIELKVNKK